MWIARRARRARGCWRRSTTASASTPRPGMRSKEPSRSIRASFPRASTSPSSSPSPAAPGKPRRSFFTGPARGTVLSEGPLQLRQLSAAERPLRRGRSVLRSRRRACADVSQSAPGARCGLRGCRGPSESGRSGGDATSAGAAERGGRDGRQASCRDRFLKRAGPMVGCRSRPGRPVALLEPPHSAPNRHGGSSMESRSPCEIRLHSSAQP